MKLSDAIEQGWSKYDQVRGPYVWPIQAPYCENGETHEYDPSLTTGVCALGAASIAVEPESRPGYKVWFKYWPELTKFASPEEHPLLPLGDPRFKECQLVHNFVTHMNDNLDMSKEEIIAQVRAWGL